MHILLIDDRDSKYREACQGWQEIFATRRKDGNGDGIATDISFREAMEQARSLDVDLVALILFTFRLRLASKSIT